MLTIPWERGKHTMNPGWAASNAGMSRSTVFGSFQLIPMVGVFAYSVKKRERVKLMLLDRNCQRMPGQKQKLRIITMLKGV